jgi:hypothetical protein
MKKIACYTLHYGKEYLAWSIRSVQDAVDEIHILYSPTPSFGGKTILRCPETEKALYNEAHRFAKKPVLWHRGSWKNEGEHRAEISNIAKKHNTELILIVDADEIWDTETAKTCLQTVWNFNAAHSTRVNFVHFYMSFNWVCYEPAMPIRIIDTRQKSGCEWPKTWCIDGQAFPVLHFGYAQSSKITAYKHIIHGHRAHIRPEWWNDKFINWKPGVNDVNPFGNSWNPQPVHEPLKSKIKELMYDHPYFGVQKIV